MYRAAYTPRGQTASETKANGNTVAYTYYLDGLLRHQIETQPDGTVVSEHTLGYDANGNRVSDVARTMDADNHNKSSDRTYEYSYDPRDRIAEVVKTRTGSGAVLAIESYTHDAASNVISQAVGGSTTAFNYDRNRLLPATTDGVTGSYNYDPFGRLNTVTAAGQVVERYAYDGFDRIVEHTSIDGSGAAESTSYTYDPFDRTTSRTDATGQTTEFTYLGLSGQVLSEEIAGQVQTSYQYSPWGKRLSQVKHNDDGSTEAGFYGYNPHTDVEVLTDTAGDPVATYGYTAYGSDDEDEFTGVDAPDAGTPGEQPYNVYRFNAKRFDTATGTYDMGFRDYDPGLNRYLSRDMYLGALADLNLGLNPWTANRYAFTGGNPITLIELDGHVVLPGTGGALTGGARVIHADDDNPDWLQQENNYQRDLYEALGYDCQQFQPGGNNAELKVAEKIGVGRNVGAKRATVPGSGPGGFRVPDFNPYGPAGTIATRGTVVEVKDVAYLTSSRQLRDMQAFASSQGVPLEIFTNARLPQSGWLARGIARGDIIIGPLP